MCGVCGMVFQLRMGFHVLESALHDLTFALIAEGFRGVIQRKPVRLVHLDPHLRRNVAQTAGAVQQQIKADDLEDARVVAPVAHIVILDVGELADQLGAHPSFFADLAQSSLLRLLTVINRALRQSNNASWCLPARISLLDGFLRPFHVRLDDRQKPAAAHLPQHHTASRELAHHEGLKSKAIVWQSAETLTIPNFLNHRGTEKLNKKSNRGFRGRTRIYRKPVMLSEHSRFFAVRCETPPYNPDGLTGIGVLRLVRPKAGRPRSA